MSHHGKQLVERVSNFHPSQTDCRVKCASPPVRRPCSSGRKRRTRSCSEKIEDSVGSVECLNRVFKRLLCPGKDTKALLQPSLVQGYKSTTGKQSFLGRMNFSLRNLSIYEMEHLVTMGGCRAHLHSTNDIQDQCCPT